MGMRLHTVTHDSGMLDTPVRPECPGKAGAGDLSFVTRGGRSEGTILRTLEVALIVHEEVSAPL